MGGFEKVGFQNNPMYDFDGKKEGALIEGEYQGGRVVESVGSTIHCIKKADGGVFDFWGSGALNWKLSQVNKGDKVKITYRGMKKDVPIELTDKKGKTKTVKKDVHQYDVEVWKE